MSVEADIVAVIGGAIGAPRVFARTAPFNTERPYATYQQIGGYVISPIAKEVPNQKNGFFQVVVWTDRSADADELSLRIEAALITADEFSAKPMAAPLSVGDDDLKRYGKQQDFSIWSAR